MTHDYKRHGTTTLFAALDVATGEVVHECLPRHRHQEFLRFLRKIERSVASELDIHVILDNYATHKHPAVRAWLDKHPRVHFHFIPTSSSWLNLVERFFSELTTRQLKRLEGQQSERDFGYTALESKDGQAYEGRVMGTLLCENGKGDQVLVTEDGRLILYYANQAKYFVLDDDEDALRKTPFSLMDSHEPGVPVVATTF